MVPPRRQLDAPKTVLARGTGPSPERVAGETDAHLATGKSSEILSAKLLPI